ncbi:MAG: hypothetical protein Q8R20_02605 [Nanoarchaeota archaeon]|nr:hypothetical protein [Nanoarchaeota archaeon]
MILHRCDICRKEVDFADVTSVRGNFSAGERLSADLCPGCAEQCLHILRKRLEESARVYKTVRSGAVSGKNLGA